VQLDALIVVRFNAFSPQVFPNLFVFFRFLGRLTGPKPRLRQRWGDAALR